MRKIGSSAVRGTGSYKYLNDPPARYGDYVSSAKRPAQRNIAGKDISARVDRAANVNGGFSGRVSRNGGR